MAVGNILSANGINVLYTRTDDIYQTPFQKAQIANESGSDFFISFHRNSSPTPNQYSGVETLVYDKTGIKYEMAQNINAALEEVGFKNLGVKARPGLVVLRRTNMPSLLIETGFINTEDDNELFDEKFQEIAEAIAGAILYTLNIENNIQPVTPSHDDAPNMQMTRQNSTGMQSAMNPPSGMQPSTQMPSTSWSSMQAPPASQSQTQAPSTSRPPMQTPPASQPPVQSPQMSRPPMQTPPGNQPSNRPPLIPNEPEMPELLYRVQIGAFRNRENADKLLYELEDKGYPAFILFEDGLFKVQVGAFRNLGNAIRMEQRLREDGYATWITT